MPKPRQKPCKDRTAAETLTETATAIVRRRFERRWQELLAALPPQNASNPWIANRLRLIFTGGALSALLGGVQRLTRAETDQLIAGWMAETNAIADWIVERRKYDKDLK
jgi:hypothetical protein